MPKYVFLKKDETLNKNNFKQKLNDLLKLSKKKASSDSPTKRKLEEFEIESYDDKINYFIKETKKYITPEQTADFAKNMGINKFGLRKQYIDYLKKVLSNKYIEKDDNYEETMDFLNDRLRTDQFTNEEIINRILPLIKEEARESLSSNPIISFYNQTIKDNFDSYLDYINANLSEDEIRALGENLNNYKSKFDYTLDDKLGDTIYDADTENVIQGMRVYRKIDGVELTDEELKEYENALHYANNLVLRPRFQVNDLIPPKQELDHAIAEEYKKDAEQRLNDLGKG